MAVLGRICLLLALAVCVYGIGASLYGVRSGRLEFSESGRRAVYALAGILTVAFAVLEIAFLRNDFAFNTVADTSSRTTPTFYRAAAVWSSQEGSLLLWAWLLSLWSSLALFLVRKRMRDVAAYATAILLGFGGFFIALMVFYATPFATTSPAPAEGVGLDPLLRFPTMMIHPPMLYSGYTLCTIPLAFAMGALLARRVDADWIRATRRFAFAAWLFLGVGILLGARWSYAELGWGGYWGWDAVENASLMPWLTGTAFLHSLMIQEKRGMLKVWNVSLVLATGTLAIMGTFLVRSGDPQLDPRLRRSDPGRAVRGADRRADRRLDLSRRLAPRHAALRAPPGLAALARIDLPRQQRRARGAVLRDLLGHLLPADLRGADRPRSVGRAAVVRPLHGAAGADPRAAERHRAGDRLAARDARQRAAQLRGAGLLSALVALVALLGAGVSHKPFAIAMFCCAAFVLGSIGQEFFRGVRARRAMAGEAAPVALLALVRRNRRRYGGYIVHVGIAVLFVGVAASSSFQHAAEQGLSPGSSTRVGAYTIRYVRPTATITPKNDAAHTGSTLSLGAVLDVSKHGHHVATLRPSEGYYDSGEPSQGSVGHLIGGQAVSHISMSAGVTRDVWTAIAPNIGTARVAADRHGRQPHAAAGRGRGGDRLPGARLPEGPAAGAVPLHRLAARDVDLDRRPDRVRRRPDRDLAGAERRAPPRERALARAPRRGLARA